jgi:hypothetical protein
MSKGKMFAFALVLSLGGASASLAQSASKCILTSPLTVYRETTIFAPPEVIGKLAKGDQVIIQPTFVPPWFNVVQKWSSKWGQTWVRVGGKWKLKWVLTYDWVQYLPQPALVSNPRCKPAARA